MAITFSLGGYFRVNTPQESLYLINDLNLDINGIIPPYKGGE